MILFFLKETVLEVKPCKMTGKIGIIKIFQMLIYYYMKKL